MPGEDDRACSEIMEAMLLCSGERGFRNVELEMVCARSACTSEEFRSWFRDLDHCFADAFGAKAARLWAESSTGLGQSDLRDCLERGLESLFDFVAEQPLIARAMLLEVHAAGVDARAMRQRVLDRIASALEHAACAESSRSSRSPLTAPFMVGAIEQIFVEAVTRPSPRSASFVPGVAEMVCEAFGIEERRRPPRIVQLSGGNALPVGS